MKSNRQKKRELRQSKHAKSQWFVYWKYLRGLLEARLPEWSKGVDSSPTVRSTRGFKSHSVHFYQTFYLHWFHIFSSRARLDCYSWDSHLRLHCTAHAECPEVPRRWGHEKDTAMMHSVGTCIFLWDARRALPCPPSSPHPDKSPLLREREARPSYRLKKELAAATSYRKELDTSCCVEFDRRWKDSPCDLDLGKQQQDHCKSRAAYAKSPTTICWKKHSTPATTEYHTIPWHTERHEQYLSSHENGFLNKQDGYNPAEQKDLPWVWLVSTQQHNWEVLVFKANTNLLGLRWNAFNE